jgi:hypothetical protein
MAATAAVKVFGTTFTWNAVAIAELTQIGFPGIDTTMIDVSSEDSDDAFREYIAGMHDGGELTLEGNFIKGDTTGQIAFLNDAIAGTARTGVITLQGGGTWTFTGLCKSVKPGGDLDGQQTISFTVKVSGKPVLALTASADATTIAYEDSVGVKTSLPVFASATYGPYTVTVDTASTYIKVTVTDGTAATITAQATIAGTAGPVYNLTTAVQSGQIAIGDAATTTLLTIICTDSGEIPVTYTIYVVRP